MRLKRTLLIALGCVSLAVGAAAVAIPLLPSMPFLILSAFSFARSDERLHAWFLNTKLYKQNLESFLSGRGMTGKAKLRVMLTLTIVMAAGVFFMRRIHWAQILLGVIWAGHVLLFLFGIRTVKEGNAADKVDRKE